MTGFRARARLLAAVSAGVMLAACSDSAPEKPADSSAASTPKPAGPKPATAGAQMVAAVYAGKSANAVGVYFSLGNSPKVASALPVEIAVIAHEPFSSLQAHFESQAGLTIISGEDLPRLAEVKAESTIAHQLVLMPDRDGVFVVTVGVETEGKEGIVSRVFSIPVIVSPAVEPAAPANSPGS
jgi:hypothetical protein